MVSQIQSPPRKTRSGNGHPQPPLCPDDEPDVAAAALAAATLLPQANRGDLHATNDLLRRVLRILRHHARRDCGDCLFTDDLCQETCLSLLSRLRHLRQPNALGAVYFSIVNPPLVAQLTFQQGSTRPMTTMRAYENLNRLTSISSGSSQSPSFASFVYLFTSTNLTTSVYSPNRLNQYTSRTVPGFVDSIGAAKSDAAVSLWGADGSYAATSRNEQLAMGYETWGSQAVSAVEASRDPAVVRMKGRLMRHGT